MHGWTLLSVRFEWVEARVTLNFRNPNTNTISIVAKGAVSLVMPKKDKRGRSVSVNNVTGPKVQKDGLFLMIVKMQSGDAIEVLARSFALPVFSGARIVPDANDNLESSNTLVARTLKWQTRTETAS